ncbi:MAG: 4Fe-4S binding protein [Candidatus Thorarchaeota archaeon]|nr:4Fe-4S binding protein [Candidatus Thorarchaeota archaeon]
MEKRELSIGEKPVISMDVEDGKVRLTWKTSHLTRSLDHDISKCVGCNLCLPCPWEAITMGPVKETASGLIEGAPLVNVDPEACTFCGLCDSACIFRAFEAKYEGEGAINEYNRIEGTHKIDEEKCAPCLLCEKVCPTGSLHAEVKVDRKEDCVIYQGKEYAKGTIKIDEDKCSLCGLCEILCPEAIKIFWSDSAEPPQFRPAVAIRVDEDHCDYCGLCADICPDEAIEITCTESGKRTIRQPEISGTLKHEDSTCVKCGLCAEVCPYDALEVVKPFTGEVRIIKLEKCDPTGCNNCFNICPTKAIYPTGTADKIAILDESCVYCGACEHSCPYDVLEVVREGYVVEELERAREWERSRKVFFDAVIGKGPPPSNVFERDIVVKAVERPRVRITEASAWDSVDGEREVAMKAIERVRDLLRKKPRTHLQLERGQTDKVIKTIKDQEEPQDE